MLRKFQSWTYIVLLIYEKKKHFFKCLTSKRLDIVNGAITYLYYSSSSKHPIEENILKLLINNTTTTYTGSSVTADTSALHSKNLSHFAHSCFCCFLLIPKRFSIRLRYFQWTFQPNRRFRISINWNFCSELLDLMQQPKWSG